MWLNRYRQFIVLLALLAFASQSLAVVTQPCHSLPTPSAVIALAAMKANDMEATGEGMHCGGHMQAANASTGKSPCCCHHANCSDKNCMAMSHGGAAAVALSTTFPIERVTAVNSCYTVSYTATASASLFRPPIFR